jgi:hypothetical protein
MQDTVGFVNTEAESFEERYITNQDPESNGQQQQRFVLFGYGKINERRANQQHDNIAEIDKIVSGICQKLYKKFH